MKDNLLIFGLIKNNYKPYDKTMLIDGLLKSKKFNISTIYFKNIQNYQKEFFNAKGVKLYFFDDNISDKRIKTDDFKKEINLIISPIHQLDKKLPKKLLFEDALNIVNQIVDHIKKEKVKYVMVWGGSYLSKLYILASKITNIKYLILEEGYYRNYGIQASRVGVNYQSEFLNYYYKHKDFVLNQEIKTKTFTKKEKLDTFTKSLYDEEVVFEILENKEKYIFIPLQINTDTQIISHSPHIKNMYELVQVTINAIEIFNSKYNLKIIPIFKVHPEHEKQDKLDNFKYIYNSFKEKGYFVKDFDLDTLIYNSELIITINSTVGIQSLLYNKKLLVLGNAIYSIPDVCYILENKDSITKNLEEAYFDDGKKEILPFLNILKDYHLKFNLNSPSKENILDLTKRLYKDDEYYVRINNKYICTPSKRISFELQNTNEDTITIVHNEEEKFSKTFKDKVSLKNISLNKFKNEFDIIGNCKYSYSFSD